MDALTLHGITATKMGKGVTLLVIAPSRFTRVRHSVNGGPFGVVQSTTLNMSFGGTSGGYFCYEHDNKGTPFISITNPSKQEAIEIYSKLPDGVYAIEEAFVENRLTTWDKEEMMFL